MESGEEEERKSKNSEEEPVKERPGRLWSSSSDRSLSPPSLFSLQTSPPKLSRSPRKKEEEERKGKLGSRRRRRSLPPILPAHKSPLSKQFLVSSHSSSRAHHHSQPWKLGTTQRQSHRSPRLGKPKPQIWEMAAKITGHDEEEVQLLQLRLRQQNLQIRQQERLLRQKSHALRVAQGKMKKIQENAAEKEKEEESEKDVRQLEMDLEKERKNIEKLRRMIELEKKNHHHQLAMEVRKRRELEERLGNLESHLSPAAKILKNKIFSSPRLPGVSKPPPKKKQIRKKKKTKVKDPLVVERPAEKPVVGDSILSSLLTAGRVLAQEPMEKGKEDIEAGVAGLALESKDSLRANIQQTELDNSLDIPKSPSPPHSPDTENRPISAEDNGEIVDEAEDINEERTESVTEGVEEWRAESEFNGEPPSTCHSPPFTPKRTGTSSTRRINSRESEEREESNESRKSRRSSGSTAHNSAKTLSSLEGDHNSIIPAHTKVEKPNVENPFDFQTNPEPREKELIETKPKQNGNSAFLDELFGPRATERRQVPIL